MKGRYMATRILNQLEEACAEELALVRGDLGQLEQSVGTMLKSLGVGLLQRLVDQGRNGYQGPCVACTCGGLMRFVGHRPKAIHTLFGWITVQRAYYCCPQCGRSKVPYDEASGLGSEQLSPALAKVCCLLAVDDSFAEVSRKLACLFAEEVSDTTVERLVHQVGSVSVKQQEKQLERFSIQREIPISQVQVQRLYVSVDGTNVHEQDAWHEAKTGCIYWYDEHLRQHKCYVGRFCNSEEFGWQMWLAACRHGLREALEDLCRYLSVNEEQMRYDVFRTKGYDIGSAAVEGACKHVVGKRLKQSGMIWTRAGSSATLALRICWLNEQWDSFWEQKPLAV
jgi:hypothetical protein